MGIVAKYKFDGSVYADLIPEFNAEFTDYNITDEVDSENSNHIIRTIESDSLPTLMRFGVTPEDSGNGTEREKSLMEIIELDTSNLTNASSMFRTCSNLSILHDINTWNVSNVINMASMFGGGCGITSLDLSNWDTSKVITFDSMFSNDRLLTTLKLFKIHSSCVNVYNMFLNCNNLITLDLSSWDTESIEYYTAIFKGMAKLSSLDISNFSIKSAANVTDMFTNTLSLTDIGMIYCDKSTINKVASLLPTDHNITIWVESDDILQYDQYDHITYKTQKVQDTVHLNSPLLMGDTIEVIDGKTYHVHRWEKVVLNGSENWSCYANGDITSVFCLKTWKGKLVDGINLYCDKFPSRFNSWNVDSRREGVQVDADIALTIQIDNSKLSTLDVNSFKQWLSENPTTVIYELTTPYYELISEEPLELTLLDTTDNTINNNSILPSNMTIANKELSTIAIKPSTTYTLSFDKSNEDSEVTIDICGGEQITTVLNRIELTTPSELGNGIRFISSDGCIVSNVRLLEGSLVKEAIPKETFEGLKNSFDDGYIIGENLLGSLYIADSYYVDNGEYYTLKLPSGNGQPLILYNLNNIKPGKTYTIIYDVDITQGIIHTCFMNANISSATSNEMIAQTSGRHIQLFTANAETKFLRILNRYGMNANFNIYKDIIVLEGDHTHLSEAELMRYIEKGTSHYEEEDYNHAGKYKVEYKVTGKNKFDKDRFVEFNKDLGWNCDIVTYNNKECVSIRQQNYQKVDILNSLNLNKKKTYSISFKYFFEKSDEKAVVALKIKYTDGTVSYDSISVAEGSRIITTEEGLEIEEMHIGEWGHSGVVYLYDFQIEEGTVATEYEPYKEDIKTYYLSSPLLEGDTIEDINGKATHVKRYRKVVLDGGSNEPWVTTKTWDDNVLNNTTYLFNMMDKNRIPICDIKIAPFSDKFIGICSESMWGITITSDYEFIQVYADGNVYIRILQNKINGYTTEAIKAWLSENPTTLVYKLRTPIYEPISDEPILLDSYTNGHLDLSNENIPIQKTEFRNFTKELAYLQPSTDYVVKFSSDNIGIAKVYLDSSVKEINVVKGINKVIITTPSAIVNNNIIIDGIGFNVSDVQVVANAIKDGDIKDFDYFKGLQSSFEDGLVTDEADENYGKYKVECKIVGKNKFDGELELGYWDVSTGKSQNSTSNIRCKNFIKISNPFTISSNLNATLWVLFYDKNFNLLGSAFNNQANYQKTEYIKFYYVNTNTFDGINIQIEEGTQATSYEPYKESIHTLYLNSPLLKGDKLVVHDGKLCHYHKMGMVVLDGSEDEKWTDFVIEPGGKGRMLLRIEEVFSLKFCDKLLVLPWNNSWNTNKDAIASLIDDDATTIVPYITAQNANGFKQWLQKNPTTVVYELAEPYYEPIEPQLSQYSFSTVKDGDMEIITVLPIEKINLTYRTDINGVSSIEEQIASIQESTDISSIIDEEVDE